MQKRFFVLLTILVLLGIVYANVFYPRLYIKGYNPLIENQIVIYKIDKGMNLRREKPFHIEGFAPQRSEKIDFENKKVIISAKVGEKKIHPDVVVSFDAYFEAVKMRAFRKSMKQNITAQTQQTQAQPGGLISEFVIELPRIAMPRAVQRVLGSKAGRLNLDGTQKVTLQAGSTKRKQVPIYETNRGSTFDLKMEQETNLRLTGTIGEKIAVNMKYNSKQDEQFFDPNNINIKYTGTEDEIIQSIEAGNIALSLSGSRYISYSTSSQGLFGVTSKWKYGDLGLTMIASKEEGQKNTQTYIGQSQADSTIFRSKDYAPRTMYYIADPYDLFEIYGIDDQGDLVPNGWIGNAIKTDITGAWLLKSPNLLPANGTVKLYLDDANATNNEVYSAVGDTIFFSPTDFYVPYYDELIEGTDFVTDYNTGIIQILRAIDRRMTLAVRYVRRDGIPVPFNSDVQDGILHAKVIRRRNQEYNPADPNNVWHYQMRNVYNMNKNNIKSDGFTLDVYTENVDRSRNYNLPDSLAVAGMVRYNDYLRLDSNGDGMINGDDATVNLSAGLIFFPFIEPFQPLGDGNVYEDEHESVYYQDITLFMAVKGKIGRDAIELAQGGLLKGSVRVRVNGRAQRENVDYLVDYDFGRITFLTAAGKDPDAKIEIDYEFRSMFDVAKKSLAGLRADWNITDYAKLGGTVIYRSENVSDKRPKIGNENIEMIMADIDGNITVKPKFVTRWIDALPLINTNAESRFTLSGEIALTMPNIYGDPDGKKNIAYIDDMESIVDQYPLGVTFSTWVQGSKPYQTSLSKGRTNWYNPKNIRREQIEDPSTLTERERKETVTVLAMKVFPNNLDMPGSNVWSWGGIMKYLGNQLDFSSKKYIEILVKLDHRVGDPMPSPVLRIDLGDINEDFYTEFGGLNVLNSEDKNNDGVLTLDEDIGLDGIPWGEPGHDPNDRASNEMDQYGDYPHINGTEGNRILDTEDLDGNGVLNQLDRYFSYAISLRDSTYLENVNHDGWRLYRIPLNDPAAYQIANSSATGILPSLKKISYGRIWLETDETAKVLIAEASVVGNKWEDFLVRYNSGVHIPEAELPQYNTSYISGIVNNQKNRTHYTSPPGTVYIEDRRESSESSLTLTVSNLNTDHQILLRQRMISAYSLLSYDKIKFWVYPEASETSSIFPDSLDIVFRIGADSTNFYQIRQRTAVIPYSTKMDKNAWREFTYTLQDITSLKEKFWGETSGSERIGDVEYSFKGTPTLTNIRELSFGVFNPKYDVSNPQHFNGTIYYNDLRVADPFEDIGWARRLTFNSTFADVMVLDVDYENKSENFNPNIQRGRVNTFTQTTSLNITNKYFINKLFPNSWSLDMPLTLYRNYTLGIPRYRANSDLIRENIIDPADKEREKTETLTYAADFAFSQRVAPKSKFLLYTINKLSLSGRLEQAMRNTPTTQDSTITWRGTLNYNLSFSNDKVSFPLYKSYRLGWFPSSWNNSFSINSTEPNAKNWELREGVYGWHKRTQSVPTKVITTTNNINWNLTSDVTAIARYNTKRDLIQKNYVNKINIGEETEFVQDLGLNYNPNYFPRIMNFTASGTTKFSDFQRRYTQNVEGVTQNIFQSDGNNNRTFRTNITLMNASLFQSLAQKMNASHQARLQKKRQEAAARKTESGSEGKTEVKQENKEVLAEQDKKAFEELKEEDKKAMEELKEEEVKPSSEEEYDPTKFDGFENEEAKALARTDSKYDGYSEEYMEKYGYEPKDDRAGYSVPKDGEDRKKPESGEPRQSAYVPAQIVSYLARIKNITTSYQNTYTMNYTRKDERPPFAFQIGLPHSVAPDFLDSKSDDNTFSVGSGFTFSRNLDSIINYSYSINKRYSNASSQSTGQTFPDIMISLLDFERWIGVSRFLKNSRINSGFQYTVRRNGTIDWVKPKQETRTISLNPLLGLATNVMGLVSTNISVSVSSSENVTDMETYQILKTMDSQSLNGSFSYSYREGRGFSIPFTDRKIHIKNELTSSLALAYEQNFDETKGNLSSVVDRNTTRLSITPGLTYQFDDNIRGGLTSSYELTSDKKRDDGTRIFRLGIWVEVQL